MRLPVPAINPTTRCPLTVIGGFLGTGKTTLLNRLLADAKGRTAVLVNDFGAVNVDAGLIADHDGKTLRLTNGCVCCSLADGFLDTLMRVLGEPEPFDHIVIEASGVGDPWAIAEIALVEPGLVLHGVIVLTDAERLPAQIADPRIGDTVRRQIRAADILVLNKCDLVNATGLAAAYRALAVIRPDLAVIESVDASVPEAVLALDLRRDGRSPSAIAPIRAEAVDHEALFQRLHYRRAGTFDRNGLDRALASAPAWLLRLKGRVRIGDEPRSHLLQMVGRRWRVSPLPDTSDEPIELVAIATGGSDTETALAALLDTALLTQEPKAFDGDHHRCE